MFRVLQRLHFLVKLSEYQFYSNYIICTSESMSDSTFSYLSCLQLLTQISVSKSNKCVLRLLDTVFVNQDLKLSWYFTTGQSLSVAKKKDSNTSVASVLERFEKFALANPRNESKHVAIMVHSNGIRELLKQTELVELLQNNLEEVTLDNSYIQVFQRPHDEYMDVILAVDYHLDTTGGAITLSFSTRSAATGNSDGSHREISESDIQPSALNDMVEFTNAICKFMSVNMGNAVRAMTVEFIMDEANHAWVTNIPSVTVVPSGTLSEDPPPATVGARKIAEAVPSSLPSVKPSSREGSSRPSSRPTSTSNNTIHIVAPATNDESTAFLRRDGNGYASNFSVDELPGLRAWVVGKANANNDRIQWNIDMGLYGGACAADQEENLQMKKLRSKSKHVMPSKNITLLKDCESVLLARPTCDVSTTTQLQSAWRNAYDKYLVSLTRASSANEDVVVCGNVNAIVQKIEGLIKASFSFVPGNSDAGNKQDLKSQLQADEEELKRLDRVASAGSHEIMDAGDSFGGAPKSSKEGKGKKGVTKGAARAKDLQGLYADPKAGKGKKPIVNAAGVPVFSKNSMDAPPSMDLMAKFAAEKERQMLDKQQPQKETKLKKKAKAKQPKVEEEDYGSTPNDLAYMAHQQQQMQMQQQMHMQPNAPPFPQQQYSQYNSGSDYINNLNQPSVDSVLTAGSMIQSGQGGMMPPGSVNSAMYQQGQFQPQYSYGGVQPLPSVTDTENSFMLRQAQQGDIAQFSVIDDGQSARTQRTAGTDKIVDTLKERIAHLENTVTNLTNQVSEKDAQLDNSEAVRKKLNLDMSDLKKGHYKALGAMREEHEVALLQVQEDHGKKMAELITNVRENPVASDRFASSPSRSPSKFGRGSSPNPNGANGLTIQADTGASNKKIFEQVELLQREYKRLQDSIAEERRMLKVDYSTKITALEKGSKAEVDSLKAQITILEDKLLVKDEEFSAVLSKLESQTSLCKTLDQNRLDAVEECARVKSDLKNVQQTVAASYKLEASQGLGVGVDAETAIKLNDAKSEAKLRQQANKVDFLKAQLAAEQSTNEDIRRQMDNSRVKLEELKEEFRLRMQEGEQSKRVAVEEAELRAEVHYEDRMCELTSLQSKLGLMQNQLQDSQHEQNMVRQKEEASKSATAKAHAQISVLKAEIEMLRGQIEEFRNKATAQEADEANKYAHDAMIRRLDNERQYLKSQLTSEITLKNELQTALSQCQVQLQEIQAQWKKDVDTLKEMNAHDAYDSKQTEQRLMSTTAQLENEVSRLTGNNKDLKEGYNKLRDQLRVDQLTMENMRILEKKIVEDLENYKDELKHVQQAKMQAEDLALKQGIAMKEGLLELEKKKDVENDKLKEEIVRLYEQNAEINSSVKSIRNEFAGERSALECRVHALRVFNSLNKWKMSRVSMFFRIWSTNNTIMTVAAQFKGQLKDMLKKTKEDAETSKAAALEKAREALLLEEEGRVAQIHTEYEDVIAGVRAEEEEKKAVELDELAQQFDQTLAVKDEEWQAIIHKVRDEHQHEIASLNIRSKTECEAVVSRFEIEKAEFLAMSTANTKEQVEDAKKSTEDHAAAILEKTVRELETEHQKVLAEHISNQRTLILRTKRDCEQAIEQIKKDKDNYYNGVVIADIKVEHEEALKRLKEECDLLQAAAVELKGHENDAEKAKFRQDLHEETETRIRILRQEWSDEMSEKIATEKNAQEDSLRQKLEQHMKQYENERVRGIKLETTKWKQVIKDMEKRYGLEISQARDKGFDEREGLAQAEMHELSTKYELRIQQLKDQQELTATEITKEKAATDADHAKEIENVRQDAIWITERDVKLKLDKEWTVKMDNAVSAESERLTAEFLAKLEKEQQLMEKFKEDQQRQNSTMAMERRVLQDRVNATDELIQQMKDVMHADKDQILRDFESERAKLNDKHERSLQNALKEMGAEHAAKIESVTSKMVETSEIKIKANKQVMDQELEQCVKQLHEKNDKVISGLENAMADLRKEKNGIVKTLEETTTKLEDAEDALYDLQQSTKRTAREHSFAIWKLMTGIMRMRVRFQSGMKDFEMDASIALEKAKKRAQLKLNDMTLVAMRVVALIMENEESRRKVHTTLLQYRSTDLVQKKTQVQMFERELERLTTEKDSLEDQRDTMEDEVAQLEQSVKDLEEQIRDHNRSSTMQNGRVNVAHARKKRRLDAEFERILDLIEQKRQQIIELDDRITDKTRQRDEKEAEIVDIEKALVQILIEQQKLVLEAINENRNIEEKCKMVVQVVRLPYPAPSATPVMKDVLSWVQSMGGGGRKESSKNLTAGSRTASSRTLLDEESVGSNSMDGDDISV